MTITEATLAALAAGVFGRDAVIDGWSREPIAHRRISLVTGNLEGVELFGRDREVPVRARLVRKTLRRYAGDANAGDRFAPGQEPDRWNYWRREYEANDSAILRSLPNGLRAPRCFLREASDDEATLWLEYIDGTPARSWDDAAFHRAGVAIGRWQSEGVRRPAALPNEPWLCRSFLRDWAFGDAGDLAVACDPELWSQPLARTHFASERSAEARRLNARHADLLAQAERVPAVVAHNDLWSSNLFAAGSETVVIDWAMLGLSTVAEDVANLVYDSVWMFEVPPERLIAIEAAVFEGYAAGLDAGDAGIARAELDLAFRRIAALRFGSLAGPLLRAAADPQKQTMLAERYARPFAEIFGTRAAVVDRTLARCP